MNFVCSTLRTARATRVQKSVLQLGEASIYQAKHHFNFCNLNFNLNSSKNFTCQLRKLRTDFICPLAKSTSPGLNQTLLFFLHAVTQFLNLDKIMMNGCQTHKWTILKHGRFKCMKCVHYIL